MSDLAGEEKGDYEEENKRYEEKEPCWEENEHYEQGSECYEEKEPCEEENERYEKENRRYEEEYYKERYECNERIVRIIVERQRRKKDKKI